MVWPLILGVLGAFLANIVGVALNRTLRWHEARAQLRLADESKFQHALKSDSLRELGEYLDNAVGAFRIADYAENSEVRNRINTFLGRLEEYVGKSGEIPAKYESPEITTSPLRLVSDPDLEMVESRIEHGLVWDALAALRRTIESRLTELARRRGIELPQRSGASRILQILGKRGIVPPDVARDLQFAIEVANRGVHGLEVSADDAFESLRATQTGLARLELLRH